MKPFIEIFCETQLKNRNHKSKWLDGNRWRVTNLLIAHHSGPAFCCIGWICENYFFSLPIPIMWSSAAIEMVPWKLQRNYILICEIVGNFKLLPLCFVWIWAWMFFVIVQFFYELCGQFNFTCKSGELDLIIEL